MRRRGFTLIEMLVVFAIIGLLSTLAAVAYQSARKRARDAARVGDTAQLRRALEIYYNVKLDFPAPVLDGEIGNAPSGAGCLGDAGWEADTSCATPIYMQVTPRDPGNTEATPNNNRPCKNFDLPCHYSYARLSKDRYEIHFRLESDTGGLNAGLNCATESGVSASCAH